MSPPARWKHVMVDIEAMGPAPRGAVIAVGLVPFQLHREQLEVSPPEAWWEGRLTLRANDDVGRVVEGETVLEWWLHQSEGARRALVKEPRLSVAALLADELHRQLTRPDLDRDELHVWAKPPQFDLEILRSFMLEQGRAWPAPHRLERDSRALIDLAKVGGWEECFPPCALEHGALADAEEQAEQVVRIWARLMGWQKTAERRIVT